VISPTSNRSPSPWAATIESINSHRNAAIASCNPIRSAAIPPTFFFYQSFITRFYSSKGAKQFRYHGKNNVAGISPVILKDNQTATITAKIFVQQNFSKKA